MVSPSPLLVVLSSLFDNAIRIDGAYRYHRSVVQDSSTMVGLVVAVKPFVLLVY